MKRIKRIEQINTDRDIIESENKQKKEKIIKNDEEIFYDGAIGIWNIKPFIKYGTVYALISLEARLISAIEIMKDFEEHKAYIYGFFTKESFRNKGYGDMFLKNILEELHNIYDINKIELTVSQENRNAIRLYEKNGFQKNELLKDEYGSGEDRYLMIKVFNL